VSTPAIEVRDAWVSFGSTPVLEALDFTVDPGTFLGIIGPNGAGKSVLLKVLLGFIEPDRGTVRIFGEPPARTRSDVGYVTQHAEFDRSFPISVREVVMMSCLDRGSLFSRHGAEDRDRAMAALERVRMAHLADRQIGRISGGQLQRVLIARALAVEARLLLLDEPAANLDTRIANELHELLAELVPEVTVILVSHDLAAIAQHVESVICLNRRMHLHPSSEITHEIIETTYECPVDLILHRHAPRIVPDPDGGS
jgi:zinc transport system ATP-binding protein